MRRELRFQRFRREVRETSLGPDHLETLQAVARPLN